MGERSVQWNPIFSEKLKCNCKSFLLGETLTYNKHAVNKPELYYIKGYHGNLDRMKCHKKHYHYLMWSSYLVTKEIMIKIIISKSSVIPTG